MNIHTFINLKIFIIYMGRKLKKEEEKKTKVSVALDPELLTYYRELHINLSSLVNKLLKDYRKNGNKNL